MKTHSIQPLRILVITGQLTAISLAAFPTLKLEPVVLQQLFAPTNITSAPDGSGRIFICDQPGKIHILQNGMILPVPFLDVGSRMVPIGTTPSERGLLGMAFHPGFAESGSPGYRKFYLNYSGPNTTFTNNPSSVAPQNHVTVIAEYQASGTQPNLADPLSERIVLTYGQPQANHNGGQLEFGPDGLLYIASGDGGSADDNNAGHTGGTAAQPNGILGNGQDRRTLLGKILRIDPIDPDGTGPLTYSIPPSNPFIGQTQNFTDDTLDGPMRPEIYAYGLRNPWRFSFDKRPGGTNRLFCGDVGQLKVEEVNLITNGGNYGWRYREGAFDFDPTMLAAALAPVSSIDPIAQYAHPGSGTDFTGLPKLGIAVTGGYVYRGAAIPALQGKYLFADYGGLNARVMGLEESSPGSGSFTLTQAVPLVGGNPFSRRLSTFGEDSSGEIFVGTKLSPGVMALTNGLPEGGIYQIVPESYQPPPYQTWRTTYFPTLKTGQYLDPEGDSDGDGIGNQIEYAYAFSPLVANTSAETGFSASRNSSDFTLTFRRDPAATDLVYNLQTSPDLVTWTTIATSNGGATATGINGGTVLSDAAFPGQPAFRLITVRDNSGPPGGTRFARLRTVR